MRELFSKTKKESKINVLEVEMDKVRSGKYIWRC